MKMIILMSLCISTIVVCGLSLVEREYRLVWIGYQLKGLTEEIKTKREHLKRLKVERAEMIVPAQLEHFYGRGSYQIPHPEQIILLDEPKRGVE